ncbi:SDR family oxidoreductase [Undibacter mobilis]|uniref:SDR family NAD(P)-dependent oxidoreductase n=1 Tax=Undibacter mobilis TaxID=2292256 RepID=A0A371BB12_9BRAD|nr:SDR family oxidoreductase [Undibacter mobilis]RDV04778.1 SDR family NAD(P)-dependent oxidoreductase [Undibacter mobilis]
MTIGITGATGQLGRLIVAQLKSKVPAGDIVALVRTPAKAADLGVAAREADYTKPATLEAAFKGIDTLLLISSNDVGQRGAQHEAVVAAAKKTGVKRIVYTSILHADTSGIDLAAEHRTSEAAIKASGIPYTFLRNGWYTENYAAGIQGAVAGGALYGAASDGKIAATPRTDYAAAAVAVLTTSGHDGKTYELAADKAFTLAELAAEISRQTGKTIPYTNVSVADYAAGLASHGVPEGFAKMIAGWEVPIAQGALFDDSKTLSKLTGKPTTPLADAVKAILTA